MLIVLTGGARSGKSSLAVAQARQSANPVTFLATCPRIEGDADLARRIDDHQGERPTDWTTLEVETALAESLQTVPPEETVVIDCLTLWISNLFFRQVEEQAIYEASSAALKAVDRRRGDTFVVTNEVGLGIVPADELSRRYRDVLGRINQQWVAASDQALFMVAGRAMPLTAPEQWLG